MVLSDVQNCEVFSAVEGTASAQTPAGFVWSGRNSLLMRLLLPLHVFADSPVVDEFSTSLCTMLCSAKNGLLRAALTPHPRV